MNTHFLSFFIACCLLFTACDNDSSTITPVPPSPAPSPDPDTIPETSALEFLQSAKIGWNLGNQMDSYNDGVSGETFWGNVKINQTFMDSIAEAGFGIVRIPVTWMGHIANADNNYKLDAAWLERVGQIVDYVENAGMKAIVNIHHDGSESKYWLDIKDAATSAATRTQVKEEIYQIWHQIATHFKNYGDFLIFEGFNEIHDGGWGWGSNRTDGGLQYTILNEWNQTFVDAVRAAGSKNADRYLGICGYSTDTDLTIGYMKLPNDSAKDKLLVTVHYYSPHEYAINAEFNKWGHHAQSGTATYGNETDVKATFNKLKTKYISKGIPVYLGEYGAVRQADYEAYRNYYMEYVTKAAHDYGLVPIYWDNGAKGSGKENFGLFDRSNGHYLTQCGDVLKLMMKAAGVTPSDASYTLQSIYNRPFSE